MKELTLALSNQKAAISNVVIAHADKKVKELREELTSQLDTTTRDAFSQVVLSKETKEYAKMLLVEMLLKNTSKDYIATNMQPIMKLDSVSIEEKITLRNFFTAITRVAIYAPSKEITSTRKVVEKEIATHITMNDYVLLGTDFTPVKTELQLALRSAKNNTIREFDSLVVLIYASQLSNKKAKEIKNACIKAYGEVEKNRVFVSYDIDSTIKEECVGEVKKVNMLKLTEDFMRCENKSYVILPKSCEHIFRELREQVEEETK